MKTSTLMMLLALAAACGGNQNAAAPAGRDGAETSELDRLLAKEEISQLKARYFRYLDTKDWDGIASLFADDAEAVYNVVDDAGLGTRSEPVRGPAAIAAFIRDGVETLVTVHHGHMSEIELTSSTTANGTWAMEDILQRPADRIDIVHGFGHYHETYSKIAGEWKIKTLTLTRLRVDRR